MHSQATLGNHLIRLATFMNKTNATSVGNWGCSFYFKFESSSQPGVTFQKIKKVGLIGQAFSEDWIHALHPKSEGGSIQKNQEGIQLLKTMFDMTSSRVREIFFESRSQKANNSLRPKDENTTQASQFLSTVGAAGEFVRPKDDGVVELQILLEKANQELHNVVGRLSNSSMLGWSYVNDLSEYRQRSLFIRDSLEIYYLELIDWFPSY